jgi:hypothetical protein
MLPTLRSINLSLSSACGADCVFCPSDRGARIAAKTMSLEVARKVIDEVTDPAFIAQYGLYHFNIGENGDAFINKDAIEILRYIKQKMPSAWINVWTDLQFFTPEKMEIVVRERLLNSVGLNVDGASDRSFSAVKRLAFEHVQRLLPTFIALRERYGVEIPLTVISLTMRHYVDAVRTQFGRDPVRVKDPALLELADDFAAVEAMIRPMLKPYDTFQRSGVMFWAERPGVAPASVDYAAHACPLLSRVTEEAFIAPDGAWYACCFDSNNQLAVGNVYETSVAAVAQGRPRERLVKLLKNKNFGDIGGPCATVNCCQFGIAAPLVKAEPAPAA